MLTSKKTFSIVLIGFLIIVGLIFSSSIIEINDSGWYRINQAVNGTMFMKPTPGPYLQFFAKVFPYKEVVTIFFSPKADEGGSGDTRIKVRFQDGGTADIEGNVRFQMPLVDGNQLALHKAFRSMKAVEKKLLWPAAVQALQLTAVMMTSEDSYASKRAKFIEFAEDQVKYGVYKTVTVKDNVRNELTGKEEEQLIVKIRRNAKGEPMRNENPLKKYGIEVAQLIVKDIDYQKEVKALISAKRESLMQKVKSQADAEKAKQQAITAEATGKKEVMEEKYKQEKIKVKVVVEAQQRLEVAKLDKQAAGQYKLKKILEAEGDAAYKRKIMLADGALAQKIKALVQMNKDNAEAISKIGHYLVPKIIMGSNGNGNGNGAMSNGSPVYDMLSLLAVDAAKKLSLDMSVPKGSKGRVESKK